MALFGHDFFKILTFIFQAARLFGRIFGDKEDKDNDDKAAENCAHEINKINRSM